MDNDYSLSGEQGGQDIVAAWALEECAKVEGTTIPRSGTHVTKKASIKVKSNCTVADFVKAGAALLSIIEIINI